MLDEIVIYQLKVLVQEVENYEQYKSLRGVVSSVNAEEKLQKLLEELISQRDELRGRFKIVVERKK